MRDQTIRRQLVEYGLRMSRDWLCVGTSGNLSVYDPEAGLMYITPSGLDYEATTARDIVAMDLDGRVAEGDRKPSSEWGLHAAFYRRHPEGRGVVHTHSMYCTVMACLNHPLEAVHFAMADAGAARVPVAPYRLFGTPELAEAAVETCGDGKAVLLANHGLVTWGTSLKDAYGRACNMEFAAEVLWRALAVGTPNILTDDQMAEVLKRFQTYGQPKKEG